MTVKPSPLSAVPAQRFQAEQLRAVVAQNPWLLTRDMHALDPSPLRDREPPVHLFRAPPPPRSRASSPGPRVPSPEVTPRVSLDLPRFVGRPVSIASLGASIGSHATTIRNRMPVYDGASEVLSLARPAPNSFARFSNIMAAAVGTPWAFIGGLSVVGLWLALGPVGQWGTTWQLVINTGTTIWTFLVLFLVQNTQNREAAWASLNNEEQLRLLHELLTITRTLLPEGHPGRLALEPTDNPAEA